MTDPAPGRRPTGTTVRYRERLSVPISWWARAAVLALMAMTAIGFYLGPAWGIGVALAAIGIATAMFASAATVITVEEGQLTVGRSVIELRYLQCARALTSEQTERRGGTEADARAHLVLRPYIKTSVELTLDDPADRVPYWLVSTRRPSEFAAALHGAGVPSTAKPEPPAGSGPGGSQ